MSSLSVITTPRTVRGLWSRNQRPTSGLNDMMATGPRYPSSARRTARQSVPTWRLRALTLDQHRHLPVHHRQNFGKARNGFMAARAGRMRSSS
jgi:hypothetical protein